MKQLLKDAWQKAAWLGLAGLLLLGGVKGHAVYAQTSGSTPSPAAKGAYIRGVSAADQKNWELAIKSFGEAREAAPTWPDALYNLAYSHQQAGGRELIAIAWYRTYLAAAPGADDADQVRAWIAELEIKVETRVRKLIRRVKEAYSSMDYSSPPDRQANKLARALAYLGDFAEAKAMASGILEGRQSEYDMANAYMTIAREQARAGDLAGARESFAKAKKAAVQIPDDPPAYYEGEVLYIPASKESFYRELSGSQADAGDIAGAKETAARITDKGRKELANSYIVRTQAKSGDFAGAKETADQMPIDTTLSRPSLYGRIAEEQTRAGDIIGARESFAQAKEIAARIKDEYNKSYQYRLIVIIQAQSGDIAGAKETSALVTDNERKLTSTDLDLTMFAELSAKVHGEIGTWESLASRFGNNPRVKDFQGFVESLEDKQLEKVAEALARAANDIGLGLVSLRENEAEWKKRRAGAAR